MVPERHSKLRLGWRCWANPDLALNPDGSCGMEVSFTALGVCRWQAVPLRTASALPVGVAENSVVLPSMGLNGKSESYWLVVLGSHPS